MKNDYFTECRAAFVFLKKLANPYAIRENKKKDINSIIIDVLMCVRTHILIEKTGGANCSFFAKRGCKILGLKEVRGCKIG